MYFVFYVYVGYRSILFCLCLCRISMYFVLLKFTQDINVFCFVFI